MSRLHRSPLLLSMITISGLVMVTTALVGFVWWLQPDLLTESSESLSTEWHNEVRLAEGQTSTPLPQGIFQYQNDAWTIGLKAGSQPGQPLIWQTVTGDFTFTLRLAGITTDGLTVPQPLLAYVSEVEPLDSFSLRPIYLTAKREGEDPRYALSHLSLYQDRHSLDQPLNSVELVRPSEVLLSQQLPIWVRLKVQAQKGKAEYSLDGDQWTELGQVELAATTSGRLMLGLNQVKPTVNLGPAVTFDNFKLDFQR